MNIAHELLGLVTAGAGVLAATTGIAQAAGPAGLPIGMEALMAPLSQVLPAAPGGILPAGE
ncbi:MAG: hypothetical protein ACT4O0_07045 [Pseudonocardia sp.]